MSTAQRYQFIIGRRTAAEKLAAFLLCLRQQANAGGFRIKVPMSRNDIADFLGLTVHTVSRTFSDLARRGLIEIDGRSSIVATDPEGLCRLAQDYPHDLASDAGAETQPTKHHRFDERLFQA
ncbi:MAG: helix-turn-helix domain-containing protein [Pseudomonadota bacterium]